MAGEAGGVAPRRRRVRFKADGSACKLLGVLSEAMGLDSEALAGVCIDMDQKLVINFNPKCPQPDLTLGLKRHTNPGTITLLLQDDAGGLQATKDGGDTWITVQPVPGAFVVNLGDHGHYLSNGRFKNADHQAVVNAESVRLSIAAFQNPAPATVVYPLTVKEGERLVMEEPITFAEMYWRKMSRDLELTTAPVCGHALNKEASAITSAPSSLSFSSLRLRGEMRRELEVGEVAGNAATTLFFGYGCRKAGKQTLIDSVCKTLRLQQLQLEAKTQIGKLRLGCGGKGSSDDGIGRL
ncbi:hypothetical protein KSP40_PGU008933 [Platanthera guangdongensis]|uniref:Fe2OG dioxygenase domain-containing protein n=1 Tax=Platanthera guangdongensis TaxID=2320717 RepID=A0ABR2LE00_9ASPA